MKRALCLLLVFATMCSLCIGTASAASISAYDCLSDSKYAKVWTLATTGKVIPYTSSSLSTRGTASHGASSTAYIDCKIDELWLYDVGETNGKLWAKVSYPITSNNTRRTAYIYLSDITANTHSVKSVSTGKFLCSLRQNGSLSSSYYVAKGDTVWLLAVSGSRCQLLYPTSSSGYRIAWANVSEYEKYCGSITGTTSDGMIDVTAYFAGKTITIKSVENGKYLCADGNVSGTPLKANRDTASSWETFKVSALTSDGWVGFKAYNGNYLSAMADTTNTPIGAKYNHLYSWECFRIYQKGSNFYIRAQINNKWLCVRTDLSGAPVQAYVNTASTWERLSIKCIGEEMFISPAEIATTASENSITSGSNAYKALLSINSKYAPQLTSSQEKGTLVFMFEGVGNDASSNKRMNAMALVVKNGDIVYINRNSSTIPDYPFNPAKNEGTDMPTLKSGIYTFSTVNHRGKYAALNVNNAAVVRFRSKSSFYNSTSSAINVHRRDSNSIASSSASWVNSAGCLLVGQSGTASSGEYACFIQALGIVGSGASGNSTYKNSVTGKIIVDRTYAYSYLHNVGYSDSAISKIG